MSTEQGRVAALLLQEAFGKVVEKVGAFMIKHGSCTLSEIIKETHLTPTQVKKSLCVLIQHQIVIHVIRKKQFTMYQIDPDSILQRVRFPRWIYTAKMLYGNAGELIMEDILQQGHSQLSKTLERVSERLEEANIHHSKMGEIIKQQFKSLVEDHFLQRVKPLNPELAGTVEGQSTSGDLAASDRFELPPQIDAITYKGKKRRREESAEREDEPRAKKRKKNETSSQEEEAVDAGILWQVHHSRFFQYFRDQAIVAAVAKQVDEAAGSVMKTILTLSSKPSHLTTIHTPKSQEIYTNEIADAMPSKPNMSRSKLEQYLKILVDQQACFLQKSGDAGGGAYVIDFKKASEILCSTAIECIVKERFDSKAFRVFRLLLLKKMLDQKQVADMAMIPSKEAKEILYTLFAENFVSLQEIPKTPDYAPSRTFYLFSVQLLPVAMMVRERCYKAMGNLISKVTSQINDNGRLLERFQQHERQMAEVGRKEEAVQEMEEILTPDEKDKVEAVKRSISKLEHAELQLDETLVIITNYIQLHSS